MEWLAHLIVAIVVMIAGLLGAGAAALPGAIPTTVPAACVPVPGLGDGLQAGYCPPAD